MPALLRGIDQAGERLARHHRSRRIGRTADQPRPLAASLRCAASNALARQRVARSRFDVSISNRLAAQRSQDMPVWRITRHGDRHPIARLEHRQKRQNENRPDEPVVTNDPVRLDRAAVSIAVVPGDPRARSEGMPSAEV